MDKVDHDPARQRIITHMNGDHHDSIVRFLEHYHGLPTWKACRGEMIDLSLSELIIQCGTNKYSTKIEPPMSSYRDARERLVTMDQLCTQALKRSDITIDFFPPYTVWHRLWFTFCIFIWLSFLRKTNFSQHGLFSPLLPQAFREFCYFMQPIVWWGMTGAHVFETYAFVNGRLKRHGVVNVKSFVFWQWFGDVLVQGFVAYMRFDKLVAIKKSEKARKKH